MAHVAGPQAPLSSLLSTGLALRAKIIAQLAGRSGSSGAAARWQEVATALARQEAFKTLVTQELLENIRSQHNTEARQAAEFLERFCEWTPSSVANFVSALDSVGLDVLASEVRREVDLSGSKSHSRESFHQSLFSRERDVVVVLGGGIIGLTLVERFSKDYDVVLLDNDEHSRLALSDVAGLWMLPCAAKYGSADLSPTVEEAGLRCLSELQELSKRRPDLAQLTRGCYLLRNTTLPDSFFAHWQSRLPAAAQFERISTEELGNTWRSGFRFTAYVCHMPKLITQLNSDLHKAGVNFKEYEVKSLAQLEQDLPGIVGVERKVVAVVNCLGLYGGVLDGDQTKPLLGQLVFGSPSLVRISEQARLLGLGTKHSAMVGERVFLFDDEHPDGYTYVIPRDDTVCIGGVYRESSDTTLDANESERILRRVGELIGTDLLKSGDIRLRADRTGLRPGRQGGVRLECVKRESSVIPVLVHNYGHAGLGVTLSYGCAVKARMMLQEARLNNLRQQLLMCSHPMDIRSASRVIDQKDWTQRGSLFILEWRSSSFVLLQVGSWAYDEKRRLSMAGAEVPVYPLTKLSTMLETQRPVVIFLEDGVRLPVALSSDAVGMYVAPLLLDGLPRMVAMVEVSGRSESSMMRAEEQVKVVFTRVSQKIISMTSPPSASVDQPLKDLFSSQEVMKHELVSVMGKNGHNWRAVANELRSQPEWSNLVTTSWLDDVRDATDFIEKLQRFPSSQPVYVLKHLVPALLRAGLEVTATHMRDALFAPSQQKAAATVASGPLKADVVQLKSYSNPHIVLNLKPSGKAGAAAAAAAASAVASHVKLMVRFKGPSKRPESEIRSLPGSWQPLIGNTWQVSVALPEVWVIEKSDIIESMQYVSQ